MPGRKSKPIGLHVLQGTIRKDRHGAAQALEAVGGIPTCPDWVSSEVKAIWAEVEPMLEKRKTLTAADGPALTILCSTFVEWKQLAQAIEAEGRTYTCVTEAGAVMRRPNPTVALYSDAQRRLNTSLAEFGLSPGSRLKVAAVTESKPANRFAALSGEAS